MVETNINFRKRLGILGRKHTKMANGYVTHMRGDGLIVVTPKKRKVSRFVPLKGILLLGCGFIVFKAIMLASLGAITYNERVAKLNQGTAIEKGGAWVMQIEPATTFVAGYLKPLIK